MKRIVLLTAVAALFACEKKELPKPFTGNGSANTISVSMGSDYANQLFFQLSSETVIAQNERSIWDLAFESGADGREIMLNSAKYMAVSITNETSLSSVNGTTPVTWLYDNSKGMPDSLALHDWELNKVYILDRGQSTTGAALGKIKFHVTALTENDYTIEWGTLSSSTFTTSVIAKQHTHNASFFSFNNGGATVSIEPPKDQWDLCFTSYTYYFVEEETPYLVTGVLSNRNLVRIYETNAAFESIDYAFASTLAFTEDLDVIGYDWKFYDFGLETYIIDSEKIYVVRSVENRYYKLRFLDFYDVNGAKGTPSFELEEIVP